MGPKTVSTLKQMNLIGKSEMNTIVTVKIKMKGKEKGGLIQVIFMSTMLDYIDLQFGPE